MKAPRIYAAEAPRRTSGYDEERKGRHVAGLVIQCRPFLCRPPVRLMHRLIDALAGCREERGGYKYESNTHPNATTTPPCSSTTDFLHPGQILSSVSNAWELCVSAVR